MTQNGENSKEEIETLRKAMDLYDEETIQDSLIEIAEETPRKKQKQAKMTSFFVKKQ